MIIDNVCHSRQHEMLSLCCRRQAHEKEKKYKVDNNIEPIFLSEAVMVSFIYFLFQMVMMISAADWLSPPKSLL